MENLPQDGIHFIQQHVQNHVILERKTKLPRSNSEI